MSKVNSEESSSGQKLLKEVESISEALYVNKNPRGSVSSPNKAPTKPLNRSHLADTHKEKKSFWNWPLRALSHVRNRRFNCCFSAQVLSIEGLPPIFQDLSLTVHWKRRDESLSTRPAKVSNGRAEFKDKMTHTCSVYGSRSGPHHSAKYEAKHFLLYVSLVGSPEVDFGKHRMDLTKLLPLTLEELQDDKSSGNWSTTYQLTGKASGATLTMSFGYTVVGDTRNPASSGSSQILRSSSNVQQTSNNTGLARTITAKSSLGNGMSTSRRYDHGIVNKDAHSTSQNMEEIKDLHEVLPAAKSDLVDSVNILYQKLDEEKMGPVTDSQFEFDVVTKHIEPFESVSRDKEDANALQSKPLVAWNEAGVPFEEIKKADEVPTAQSDEVGTENFPWEKSLVKGNETDTPFEDTKKAGEVPTAGSDEVGTKNLSPEEPLVNGNETDVPFEELMKPVEATIASGEEGVESGTENVLPEEGNKDSLKDAESVVTQDAEEVINGERDLKEMIMKDLESALKSVEMLEATASEDEEDQENHGDGDTCFLTPIKEPAPSSSRDVAESVASEFLDMLGIEHSPFGLSSETEPESPRERLLREFEMETLAAGSLFDFSIEADDPQMEFDENFSKEYESDFEEGFDLASLVHDIEEEYQLESQARVSEPRAKMLEGLETESLMREWGMNENTFQNSPPHNGHNAFHPADFPVKEPFDLPPLGDGLGPVVQTKNGGFLRSMNPLLFRNSKAGGSLIMQVSTPVVVPAEMGSGIMEILQKLATAGIEKLSMQANKVMPLDDITGKTMEEVLWETSPAIDGGDRDHISEHESDDTACFVRGGEKRTSFAAKPKKFGSSSGNNNSDSEYVSLEDLAPLAMDQIEALSLEGLRIQSGMSDEDAPSDITAQSIGDISAFQGKSGCVGLEGAAGLQLLNVKNDGDDDDGLMGLSLTLDEWMKLDSGDIGDEDEINERTSKILAAHHANPLNFIRKGSKGEKRKGKKGRKCGLLGNTFTVALMVQLRDPLRNYEPVGAPMLSLIQVERLFVPPKPKIYSTVSELRKTDEEDEEAEASGAVKEEKTMEEQGIPQYRISEVHLTGMKSETDKKPWGITSQLQQVQSGSRWLMANGMGKGNSKLPLIKPKPGFTKAGDKLWSVSGSGSKWKELGKMGKLNTHVRNPNVIMPK
ncbi:PREDICTED: protein PLASTID MOVEMENT IMPAIRED 1-RELATED 1-like isoform X1 [Camelina sativa]|uniref:Protein PLASTID MOVEMENT IMPAIRED 1-RELATED 1-like isoform X1 n=1 Tax=Camelina sativa TaxID=90675 RepID=A0ABM0T4U7_CAMSA|nr:PREDICTED: protein PLASTID MOVEMENT IMPAIRED 1-RELATED 1-like isoform X1 [Camelina sativa]